MKFLLFFFNLIVIFSVKAQFSDYSKVVEAFEVAIKTGDWQALKPIRQDFFREILFDLQGNNPVHMAVKYVDKALVAFFLSLYPEWAKMKNKNGFTPVELAESNPVISSLFR